MEPDKRQGDTVMDLFTAETKNLMLERIKTRYNDGDLHGVFMIGQYYSPEQLIQEAEKGSPVGEQVLIAEKKLHDELKRLGGIP
jgi:hypothetical protein